MATIHHQVGIKAASNEVLEKITTLNGLSSWWTQALGNPAVGGQLNFVFGDLKAIMIVVQVSSDKVVWQCLEVDSQWENTLISFQLQQANGQTFVNFRHSDWREETPLFAHCSTKWAVYLLSLKELIETGKGRPYPNDIQINHS